MANFGLGLVSLALCATLGVLLSVRAVKGDDCESMLLSEKCMPDRGDSCESLPRAVICDANGFIEGQDEQKPQNVANSYSRTREMGVTTIVCSIAYACQFDDRTRRCKRIEQSRLSFGVTNYQQASCDPSDPKAPWPAVDIEVSPIGTRD